MYEEVPPLDHLFADFYLFTNVPSEGNNTRDNSLRFPDAGFDGRGFVFPRGDGDSSELLG